MINQIIQGNCLDLIKNIDSNSIDLIVTSPPYNKHSSKRKISTKDSWSKANIGYGDFEDDLPESDYQNQQISLLKEMIRVIKPKGSIFYNHKARVNNHKIVTPFDWLSEFNIRQLIIWNRKNTPQIAPIRFYPTTEYIYWITKTNEQPFFNNKNLIFNSEVWELSPKPSSHPAPFPIEIPLNCIYATTLEKDIVLDPYMGSGTTALACIQTNRQFIGFELNQNYIDMAYERIQVKQEYLF